MHPMIIWRVVLGLPLMISFCAVAANLQLPVLKVGPTTYTNVTIIGANNTDLYFRHAQGMGNVKLKYVSPDLQKRFGYDPAKATDAELKQAEADALYTSTVLSDLATRVQQARTNASANETPRCVTLTDAVSDKSLLGKTAPAVAADQWVGTRPELEGKYVLMTFWEPWSAASLQALADLSALQKQFTDRLVVVGVSTNSAADLEKLELAKLAFPLATDANRKMSAAAGITSVPSVLLVDPKGLVRYEGHPAAVTEKSIKVLLSSTD